MLLFRWVFLLLGVAAMVCLALYVATGQVRYRRLGITIVKWSVIAGLGFFAVLIVERFAIAR